MPVPRLASKRPESFANDPATGTEARQNHLSKKWPEGLSSPVAICIERPDDGVREEYAAPDRYDPILPRLQCALGGVLLFILRDDSPPHYPFGAFPPGPWRGPARLSPGHLQDRQVRIRLEGDR